MDVMLKMLNEKVGEVKGLEWSGQPFQLQSPTVLLNLIPHISDRLMVETLQMLNQKKSGSSIDERWWKRLMELGRSLHDMDLLDHVLDKVDFSQGLLREKVNQLRFLKLLESLRHSRVVLVNAMHLSERELSFLRNSPNLISLSLKRCRGISSIPTSLTQAQVWQNVRTLRLEGMSLGDVMDVKKMVSLAKLELIGVTGLRRLVLSPACVYLDLTYTWTTEMDVIELGQTVGLKKENVIGVGCVGSLSLEHARDELMKGNVEPLQQMPTTHEVEEVLEMLDWCQIAERNVSGSIISPRQCVVEWISGHSFHRLFLIKALWITRDQLRGMLGPSAFLKVLCLRGSNISRETLLGALSSSNLSELDLSACLALNISPKDISGIAPNLESLNMSNTGIETFKTVGVIPGRFGGFSQQKYLQSLAQLDISNCKRLHTLPPIELPNLVTLNLSNEQLQAFPELKFPNLTHLDLSNCKRLQDLPPLDVPNLVTLNLSNEQLQGFPEMKFPNLTHLDLSNCQRLQALPRLDVPNLKILDLSSCSELAVDPSDFINRQTASVNFSNTLQFQSLKGHTDWVWSVVELRDGRLASGSADGTVRVWDVSSGECVMTLEGHTGSVSSVVELRDDRLASVSSDNTVRMWDLSSGECVMTLEGHTGSVTSVVELRDGRLASGSHDDTVRVWDVSSGKCVMTLKGHTYGVDSVVELRDGRLASRAGDNTVRVWAFSSGECVMTMKGHTDWVWSVLELRDGRLASGSGDNTVRVWDVSNGECVMTLKGHTNWVYIVVELTDGRLASGSGDKTVRVWDVSSGECVMTLKGHINEVTSVAELRDGRLASGSGDNTVRVWDLSSGECVMTLKGHINEVTSVAELRDGRLASGSGDNTVRVWNYR